jgi:two-component system cell cycle response regulator
MSSPVPDPLPLAVLFVDPDRAGAQLLANTIRDRYATAVVGSAREAYAAMRYQTPTLIVCELRLPDINGADFLAQLRAHPATRHILLMVVSSTRSLQDKVRAFQAGADDFLVKPVDPATFLAHFLSVIRFRQIVGPNYGSYRIDPSSNIP